MVLVGNKLDLRNNPETVETLAKYFKIIMLIMIVDDGDYRTDDGE